MSNLAIGIDLGTSTSEVAFFHDGRPEAIRDSETKTPIIPSLIAVNKKGKLLVGEPAREFVDLPGYGAREVKRKMGKGETLVLGGQDHHPEELSALILSKLKHNAEVMLGEPITDVVLSVPANFDDAAKQATLHAAHLAGLNVIHLINEPTAAALAFGIENIDLEAQLVVFDFGGGTLDVTTLEMMEGVLEVKSSYGDTELGGKDFDEAMMNLIQRKFFAEHGTVPISDKSRGALKAIAEKAKIALSSHDSFEVQLGYFAHVAGDVVDLEVEVTRSEYEHEVAPLLDRARECLVRAMKDGKFRPSAIDTVLMVGGTTYMPCVRNLVEEFFGKPLKTEIDPDLAVSLGAATLAGIKKGHVDARDSLIFSDVCSMGIGIDVVNEIGGQDVLTFEALITPNTPIPFSRQYMYQLRHVEQNTVSFHIYQTHMPDALLPLEIGLSRGLLYEVGLSGTINDIPPSTTGEPHPIQLDFSYDINGAVKICAEIPGLKKGMEISFEHSKYRMSQEELEDARLRVRELLASSDLYTTDEVDEPSVPSMVTTPNISANWADHPRAKQFQPLMNRAEKLMADHPQHGARLTESVNALKIALSGSNDDLVEKAGDELTDLLFDIQG